MEKGRTDFGGKKGVKKGREEERWKERKGGRVREEDREKWAALLGAPCLEILIIYLHGYREPSHCLYILLSHLPFLLYLYLFCVNPLDSSLGSFKLPSLLPVF